MYWFGLVDTMLFIDSVFELFNDLNLIVKIFAFLMLVSWVRNHIGSGTMSWVLIAALTFFIFLDGWAIFGPIYILYMLLMFGVSGILVDFFFISAGGPPKAPEEDMESPVSSGVDIQKRMAEHAARSHAQRMFTRR
jgi:hypothetical protein